MFTSGFVSQGSPVNRLNILARHASSGLLNHAPNATSLPLQTTQVAQIPSHSSVKEWVHGYILSRISFLRFRTVLFAIDVAFYLTNWTAWLSLTRRRLAERVWGQRGKQSRGRGKFEDALEDRLREMGTLWHHLSLSEAKISNYHPSRMISQNKSWGTNHRGRVRRLTQRHIPSWSIRTH